MTEAMKFEPVQRADIVERLRASALPIHMEAIREIEKLREDHSRHRGIAETLKILIDDQGEEIKASKAVALDLMKERDHCHQDLGLLKKQFADLAVQAIETQRLIGLALESRAMAESNFDRLQSTAKLARNDRDEALAEVERLTEEVVRLRGELEQRGKEVPE